MSRVNVKVQQELLRESKVYLKSVKPVADAHVDEKKGISILTQEHIIAWLETFAEDRIMLDGCNFATVKR